MVPLSSLGKRSRKRYEGHHYEPPQDSDYHSRIDGSGPQKRARTSSTWVPGAESMKRTPRSSATRTGQMIRMDPRQRGAERGGSRLQQCREFTAEPCLDLVSRRDRWEFSSKGRCLGSRRERWKRSTTREARRRNRLSYKVWRGSKTGQVSAQSPRACW
jgi:hypothetical protein